VVARPGRYDWPLGRWGADVSTTEWGIRSVLGNVFGCRDRAHAEAMIKSTSPIIGPVQGREIVSRVVEDWKPS
jgi:hypothetical protein